MLWYVLERYVHVLLGHSHLMPVGKQTSDDEDETKDTRGAVESRNQEHSDGIKKENGSDVRPNGDLVKSEMKPPPKHVHLTQQELHGLKVCYCY